MARGETDRRVRGGVARFLALSVGTVVVLGGLAAWVGFTSVTTLQPGQAAVILRLGSYSRTVTTPGLLVHLPRPIETRTIFDVGTIQRVEFGDVDATDAPTVAESAMQTADNNIVLVEFIVQYRVSDPFERLYRVADPDPMLRDAAQAAMREVVGRNTIDGVLSERRGVVATDAELLLQEVLDRYDLGVALLGIELQDVEPPRTVRDAFDDVIAANQDRNRAINEAEGYANEVLPAARAEARELLTQATAYRDALIARAEGEADRFGALVAEYQQAPHVTRRRLYLEAMEEVLPDVEKIIIEPGTAPVLPYFPIGPMGPQGRAAAEPRATGRREAGDGTRRMPPPSDGSRPTGPAGGEER